MKLALTEFSTRGDSFAEKVGACAAAGFDGIGILEFELPGDDAANLRLLADAGLGVATATPAAVSILPVAIPRLAGPTTDPAERVATLCASMFRLARYRPAAVVCFTGPQGLFEPAEARQIVVEGLRQIAVAADEAGVRLALEPAHNTRLTTATLVCSIAEAVELLDEAGLPDVGIQADTFHLWDGPNVLEEIKNHASRIFVVQVADWSAEEGRTDRILPGEGISHTKELVDALRATGWDGYLEVEVVSESFSSLAVDDVARQAFAAASRLL